MSDTPRTDAEEYESQDEPVVKLGAVDADFARTLERELNAANESFRKLNIHTLNLVDRIRRLEEAGDALASWTIPNGNSHVDWRKAKEAKL